MSSHSLAVSALLGVVCVVVSSPLNLPISAQPTPSSNGTTPLGLSTLQRPASWTSTNTDRNSTHVSVNDWPAAGTNLQVHDDIYIDNIVYSPAHFSATNDEVLEGIEAIMQELKSLPDEVIRSPRQFFVGGPVVAWFEPLGAAALTHGQAVWVLSAVWRLTFTSGSRVIRGAGVEVGGAVVARFEFEEG